MAGAQRIKRKRGRAKFPLGYWLTILDIVDGVCRNFDCGVEDACRFICAKGGIKWIDFDYQPTGRIGIKILTEISNARVLSNRYYKARAFVRTHGIPKDQPRVRWPRAGWPGPQLRTFHATGGYEGRRLRKKLIRSERIVLRMPK